MSTTIVDEVAEPASPTPSCAAAGHSEDCRSQSFPAGDIIHGAPEKDAMRRRSKASESYKLG
jgi:hypothetical protein